MQAATEVTKVLVRLSGIRDVRDRPTAGDLAGDFDKWFDGGAIREVTGSTVYSFTDGIKVINAVSPRLSLTIHFPNGIRVAVTEINPEPGSESRCTSCGLVIPDGATHTIVNGLPFHIHCAPPG